MKTIQTVQCQNCSRWIDREQIQEHSKSHLPPSVFTPDPFDLVTPKRVDTVQFNLGIDNSHTQISSILPDYLPSPLEERERRNVPASSLTPFTQTDQYGLFNSSSAKTLDDKINGGDSTLDEFQPIPIVTQIYLGGKTTKLQRKNMKPYENPNEIKYFTNERVQPGKKGKVDQIDRKSGGDFESATEQQEHYTLIPLVDHEKKEVTQQMIITRGQRSQPISSEIDTFSSRNNFETREKRITVQPTNSLVGSGDFSRGDHTCFSCGGFYCQTCKSSIPPRFRQPIPGPNEEQAQHFYSGLHQGSNCSICKPPKKMD